MSETASAGATPAAAGATPAQTTPVSPAADPVTTTQPATGDEPLGDGGKAALAAERDAAKREKLRADKLQRDFDALQSANATDAEKQLKAAKAEGAAEVSGKYQALIRNATVRAELAGSGINPSVMDLAVMAPEFQKLTVSDDGEVDGLKEAIAIFKGSRADLFKPVAAGGTADLGTGSAARSAGGKTFTREQLRDPVFYQANKADILQAMQEGRISG